MLLDVRCLLLVVCWSILSVTCYVLRAVCRVVYSDRCLLFVVRCLLVVCLLFDGCISFVLDRLLRFRLLVAVC